jgi:hypothetical protein
MFAEGGGQRYERQGIDRGEIRIVVLDGLEGGYFATAIVLLICLLPLPAEPISLKILWIDG